jgi:hypothetical protein
MPQETIDAVDKWAASKDASRSEAIRRLVELGLAGSQPPRKRSTKAASKAREMAGQELDRLGNPSLPVEERERRKRRLTKGPSEFRDMRGDLPKPKG